MKLIKKLSSYFSNADNITSLNNGDSHYREESITLRNRILNNHLYSMYSAYNILNWLKIPDSLLKIQLPLQTTNQDLLNEFANSLETRRRVLRLVMSTYYPNALNAAHELIALLKKEYHLK